MVVLVVTALVVPLLVEIFTLLISFNELNTEGVKIARVAVVRLLTWGRLPAGAPTKSIATKSQPSAATCVLKVVPPKLK